MSDYPRTSFRMATTLAMALALGGCVSTFTTSYNEPAPEAARSEWHVSDINMVIPEGLTTTEQNSFIPKADVIWHGDQPGNRAAQAAAIVKAGVEQGFAGLDSGQDVIVTVTLRRFHSLTPKAYFQAPAGTGVHSVGFDLTIQDRRTGTLLAGPERIEADIPAAVAAAGGQPLDRLPSDVWKKEIANHVAATIRGWLGTGPDIRRSFNRMGA